MKLIYITLIAMAGLSSGYCQITRSDPHKVQPVLDKLGEIDVANQILPLLLTKDQIKQLLPVMEKCRQNVRNQEAKEAERIKALEKDADKVLADGAKGLLPPKEFLDRVNALFKKIQDERTGVKLANQILMMEVVNRAFNEGQKKAAIGVVDKIFNEEKRTWEDGSNEAKLRYFVNAVILGDRGYEFLSRLLAAK
jgi:hypothetical protein